MASHSLIPRGHSHPPHLRPSSRHVRRVRILLWRDGVANHHLADSRILSELADAVHLPSHAGVGIGILLTV